MPKKYRVEIIPSAWENFPDSGSLTTDKWLNEQGYRMIIAKKHIAIYRAIEDVVYIYHIADTQTEYTKVFN